MNQLPKDDVVKPDIAFLTDRVMINTEGVQWYGTQIDGTEDGSSFPKSIKGMEGNYDSKELNERRASMELGTIEDYLADVPVIIQE